MISDIYAKLSPGGSQGVERLPSMMKRGSIFEFAGSISLKEEELRSPERELLIKRQKVVDDMIEHTSIMDTVDGIYKKAKL